PSLGGALRNPGKPRRRASVRESDSEESTMRCTTSVIAPILLLASCRHAEPRPEPVPVALEAAPAAPTPAPPAPQVVVSGPPIARRAGGAPGPARGGRPGTGGPRTRRARPSHRRARHHRAAVPRRARALRRLDGPAGLRLGLGAELDAARLAPVRLGPLGLG